MGGNEFPVLPGSDPRGRIVSGHGEDGRRIPIMVPDGDPGPGDGVSPPVGQEYPIENVCKK